MDALPFGSGEDLDLPIRPPGDATGDTVIEGVVDEFGSATEDLFRISNNPIAGSVIFERGTNLVVRYAERATGHIFEVVLPRSTSSSQFTKTRITNNTLPKIYEAYFRSDGSAVLFRSLRDDSDVVESLSLSLTPPSTQATSSEFYNVAATALRGDIGSVAVGTGNTLFYSLRDAASIVSSAFNGSGAKTLATSAFTDWRLASAGNSVLVYTKASANTSGYAYRLNTASGGLTKVLGPLSGLIVTPNSAGNRLLYSYVDGGRTRLFAKNTADNSNIEISYSTLAEKCVWSTADTEIIYCGTPDNGVGAGEPDNWYKGITHFSDLLWQLDTKDNIAQLLAEPQKEYDVDIDAVDLKLSPDEDYLIFTNKLDLTLWALRIE